jgi:hypothetical protein
MQAESKRQARRIAQRRSGQRPSPEPASMQYASERISSDDRRTARLAMIVLGVTFVALCVSYAVLAAGQIVG